jgi:hypothetical protein
MMAPNTKPTEKTEKRLSQMGVSPLPDQPDKQIIKVDMNALIKNMLNDEDMQGEIYREASRRLDTEEAVDRLKLMLTEYLDTFMIIGYGVDANRIIVKHSKNDRDDDSLIEILRYVFMRMVQGD